VSLETHFHDVPVAEAATSSAATRHASRRFDQAIAEVNLEVDMTFLMHMEALTV
jgi:hypothetical protein